MKECCRTVDTRVIMLQNFQTGSPKVMAIHHSPPTWGFVSSQQPEMKAHRSKTFGLTIHLAPLWAKLDQLLLSMQRKSTWV